MQLIIPGVGTEQGPDYAFDINASLTLIDQHNHSAGSGVAITPNGLNISSDLSFISNNAIDVRSMRFTPQTSALALPTDLGCVYESGVDLYYNDGSGNQIRLTQGGSIVGTAGSITGLPSGTASASYSSGTFVWQAATSTPANMDFASAILRNNVANSKGLTLSPPNAMATDYSLSLPSIPAATQFVSIDTSGNISGYVNIAGGLTTTNLASNANILGSQLATNPSFNGNVATSGNITASGQFPSSNGLPMVVGPSGSGSIGLSLVHGVILSNTVVAGAGFTLPGGVVYTNAFLDTPAVIIQPIGRDISHTQGWYLDSNTVGGFTPRWTDDASQIASFTFIATGLRSV